MSEIERVRFALERIVGKSVKAWPRSEWDAKLRPGGHPTLLDEPFGPYLGAMEAPGFEGAVASGDNHTAELGGVPGLHHKRIDEKAPESRRAKLYTDRVIEDLPADLRWPDVVRIAKLDDTAELRSLVRTYVFGYCELRGDHWGAKWSDDIAKAKRREDD